MNEAYLKWLNAPLGDAEFAELSAIMNDEQEIKSRFGSSLEFGTAGLRGVMGLGTNRMNVYVIRHTTQAFADVINASGEADRGAVVCYDCRNHSREFAEVTSGVLAANGIKVRMFESMRPTPELSFAVREYGCAAGINITASHNPKEYNGYKVYGPDGAQLSPGPTKAVSDRMEELDIFSDVKSMDFNDAVSAGLITLIGAETDEKFLENVCAQINDSETVRRVADDFKLVYTPFHGTGRELVPEALRRLGMKNIVCVDEQMVPDGNFPTVVSPNPENPEGFYLAVELADKVGADFILGTDPDADRVGIMVRGRDGKFMTVTGNQTGVLLLDYVIGAMKRTGRMPANPIALKTIVTTEMARRVAEAAGVRCVDTFTGFKFMAERKNQLESAGEGSVIFSYEESYGYMLGDFVRDKDAVTASTMLAEMAAWYYDRGMTLYDALCELYEKYGYYGEKTINLMMTGVDASERMKALMTSLRSEPPKTIAGAAVEKISDFSTGVTLDAATGAEEKCELVGSNVLRYRLSDGTVILVRPSGTEPKVKVYALTLGKDAAERDERLAKYSDWANRLV
ncbi:MAG: phospho-sugar mutase [Oscillospiraceae bacterium]|nr:phospho-sugar mutase [Oscillospiraceae bacterium]